MMEVKSAFAYNQAEWENLDDHLKYITDHHHKEVMRLTLNELAKRSKTAIVKSIAAVPLQQSLANRFSAQSLGKLPPLKARQKDIRPLIHVRGALRRHKETKKPYALILGYANDIPAIRMATVKKQKTGSFEAKGSYSHYATHGKPRKGSKPGAKGRKLKKARLGGIKIGSTLLPDAFINVARYNNQVHVMRRMTKKTWKPGHTGWGYARDKGPAEGRAPFGVVRYDVKTPMERNMPVVVQKVVADQANKVYVQKMKWLIDKSAEMNF